MMACHADRPAGRRPDEFGAALFINQHFGCRCTNSSLSTPRWQKKRLEGCFSFANSSTRVSPQHDRADLGLRGEYPRKRADLGLRGEYPLSPAERAIALVATMTRMRALLSRHSMEVSDFGRCREIDQKATNELVCSSAATQTRCSVLTPSLRDWGEGEQGDGLLEGAVGQCSSQDLAAMTWGLQGRGCNRGARRGCVSMHVTRAALPQ